MDALEKHCRDHDKEMPRVKYILPREDKSYVTDLVERNNGQFIRSGARIPKPNTVGSCFCMFRLNPDGTFIPDSFQISSFPWAIHRVRDGKN